MGAPVDPEVRAFAVALAVERGLAAAAARFEVNESTVSRWCKATGVRPPGRRGRYRPSVSETVDVTCWCEAQVVQVTDAEVRRGRTRSCGRRGCEPSSFADAG